MNKFSDRRGMVLMSVLWIVLIVSFISFALAAAVRAEVNAAGSSFDSERALFMAKGAAEAVFARLQLDDPKSFPDSPMRVTGDSYDVPFASGDVHAKVEYEAARIDLNGADEKMLAALFDSLGVGGGLRDELVDSILDWRDADDTARPHGAESAEYGQISSKSRHIPANGPFNTMQEVLMVKHMTPEIYFGHTVFEGSGYRKMPGLQDLATVGSGRNAVDVNSASVDVLAALPGSHRDLAERIVAERQQKPFAGGSDVIERLGFADSALPKYLSRDPGLPNAIVATATVKPSGTSKTVRLRIRGEEQRKTVQFVPPILYKLVVVLKFGGWEY